MTRFLDRIALLGIMMCLSVSFAEDEQPPMPVPYEEEIVEIEETDGMNEAGADIDKRRLNFFTDPLLSVFFRKRGFNNFMDPLNPGFRGKRGFGFNNMMDPLNPGFRGKRGFGFNNVMDPLNAGFYGGGKRDADDTDESMQDEAEEATKRRWKLKGGAWPGFSGKRGFNNFMDPLSSGFQYGKRGFNNFMDPLNSGFQYGKRGFNNFMDPLSPGFYGGKRNADGTEDYAMQNVDDEAEFEEAAKRRWKLKGGAWPGFAGKRGFNNFMDPLNPGFYGGKRGFNNFMDPLSPGFYGGKRGFNNFIDPLSPGFYGGKRGFNNFMDPLNSGFQYGKRGFNNFMDPLNPGFYGGKRGFNNFMDPLSPGFYGGKRNANEEEDFVMQTVENDAEEIAKRRWKMKGGAWPGFGGKRDDSGDGVEDWMYYSSPEKKEFIKRRWMRAGTWPGFSGKRDVGNDADIMEEGNVEAVQETVEE